MRVYVGTTLPRLTGLRDRGLTSPVSAHAVTAALREWYVGSSPDELEYAASDAAARDSLRQLAGPSHRRARRVVVAADVEDVVEVGDVEEVVDVAVPGQAPPAGDGRRSSVRLAGPLTLAQVVSIHVDDDLAAADVAAAAAAVAAGDAGDADAQLTVDAVDGHELLWYDVTELEDLLAPAG